MKRSVCFHFLPLTIPGYWNWPGRFMKNSMTAGSLSVCLPFVLHHFLSTWWESCAICALAVVSPSPPKLPHPTCRRSLTSLLIKQFSKKQFVLFLSTVGFRSNSTTWSVYLAKQWKMSRRSWMPASVCLTLDVKFAATGFAFTFRLAISSPNPTLLSNGIHWTRPKSYKPN